MNDPKCYSKYFMNKQHIRSLNNIINSKLLKSENATIFLREILKEEYLVNVLSSDLKLMLLDVQQRIKYYGKYDFKNFFGMYKVSQNIVPVDKEIINEGCMTALNMVFPKTFFGNNNNNKIFKKCIKIIIYSMKYQHLSFAKLLQKWNFNTSPWINLIQPSQVLCNIFHWIFQFVLSAIISLNFFVTTSKINNNENLLHFFWKSKWQSFYDRKVSEMVLTNVINKIGTYSMGKNMRYKYSLKEKFKLKALLKEIPKLHLVLKPNNSYRPIVHYRTEYLNSKDKYKIKDKLYFLQKLCGKPHEKIEIQFTNLYFKWLEKDKPKLYFVKTDLSNAFGFINKAKLLRILCERHQEIQATEISMHMKMKYAQFFKEFRAEFRKPLLIRAGSVIYDWKEGLVQGYKFSPALSELFYSYMDEIYFSKLLNNNHELKLFIRVVDDYLYVSDSLSDAQTFLKALSNYKNVNYAKTAVNFPHEGICYNKEITFLGYSYNTETLQVTRANTTSMGQMCYKIKFSAAIANIKRFLESRICQTGIHINGHLFNFYHNDEELIWGHIFVTLCLSANKFCTILSLLCEENNMLNYLSVYKKMVTVKLCNYIIDTLEKNKPKDFCFIFCINHFRYLSLKALLLCSRQTYKCDTLVPHLNAELAKANCIYGKWREHGGIISKDGKIIETAIREICRKSDIKRYFKNFETLPDGFQCYNYTTLYKVQK